MLKRTLETRTRVLKRTHGVGGTTFCWRSKTNHYHSSHLIKSICEEVDGFFTESCNKSVNQFKIVSIKFDKVDQSVNCEEVGGLLTDVTCSARARTRSASQLQLFFKGGPLITSLRIPSRSQPASAGPRCVAMAMRAPRTPPEAFQNAVLNMMDSTGPRDGFKHV